MRIDCSNVPDPNETIDFKSSLKRYYKEFIDASNHEVKRVEKPIEKPVIYVYNFVTEDNLVNLKGMPAIIRCENYYNTQYVVDYIDKNGNITGKWCKVGITEGVPYLRKFYLREDNQEHAEEIVNRYFMERESKRINDLMNRQVYVVTYVKEGCDTVFGVFTSIEKATDAITEYTNNPCQEISLIEMNTIVVPNCKTNYYISSIELDKGVI